MATELIKSERAIGLLKTGAKRLNDGGGPYLLPCAGGDTHYWRLDYSFEGRQRRAPSWLLAWIRQTSVATRGWRRCRPSRPNVVHLPVWHRRVALSAWRGTGLQLKKLVDGDLQLQSDPQAGASRLSKI